MRGLLKADFKRVFKDKLLLIMGILAVVFALITPLLYALLLSGESGEAMGILTGGYTQAKSQFFGSFAIGNNLGLIAPVLLAIALCKDFSYGTVRNKVISGKSRTQIFMSLFITCSVVFVGVMLLHGFVTLGVSLIFFDYQATAFTISDFWYFLESLALDILTLLFVSAMLSWLCACMKNVGLVIVLYIAISFILTLAGSIISIVLLFMQTTGGKESTISVLEFISKINVANAATYIGAGTEYTAKDLLYLILPSTVGVVGFLSLGLWKFNKKDLK